MDLSRGQLWTLLMKVLYFIKWMNFLKPRTSKATECLISQLFSTEFVYGMDSNSVTVL